MRPAAFLIIAASASACAASTMSEPRTPKAEKRLLTELQGKVAGPPVSCLSSLRNRDMIVIDDNTVLFRDGSRRVYRNDPPGGCAPMGFGGYTLVTRTSSSEMCRGDIVQVTDLRNHVIAGSCALGDFVPYTRVGG